MSLPIELISCGLGGVLVGFVVSWVVLGRNKVARLLLDAANAEKQATCTRVAVLEEKCSQAGAEHSRILEKLEKTQDDLLTSKEKIAVFETEKQSLMDVQKQYQESLGVLQETTRIQFENLANKIFDDKAVKFQKTSEAGLNQLLVPLKERIQDFQKKVDDSFGTQAKEQFSLKKEIERIVLVNERMTQETEGLTKALRGDVKAQGDWGETKLRKILEESGLRKGTDYIEQGDGLALKHIEDGSVIKPDVIVMLPERKHIIIDSKVSLTHYSRFSNAQNDAERASHLEDYLASVKKHVDGLEKRRYQDTEKLGTPDFVLLFMPIEGAYSLAIQQDDNLHHYAWDKKIVIVCSSTLFATLKTIASIWRLELQNQNAIEIARQGGALYDKIALFVEDMVKLGTQLDTTKKTYDNTMNKLSSGTGNILRRTENLKKLGAKASKKLPPDLINQAVGSPETEENELSLMLCEKEQEVA